MLCSTAIFSLLCDSIRFRPAINVIDTYKFHRAKSKTSTENELKKKRKNNTAIFIFIYKCAFAMNTNRTQSETRSMRVGEKKINKRLSMWLYDCNIKRQTKWTVCLTRTGSNTIWICTNACTHRNMISLSTSPTMRNKFLSKSLIHIYKWVDQRAKEKRVRVHLTHGKGHHLA